MSVYPPPSSLPAVVIDTAGAMVGWSCCGILHGDIEAFCTECRSSRPDALSVEVASRRVRRRAERDQVARPLRRAAFCPDEDDDLRRSA